MAIKRKDGKYECSFCGQVYSQWQEADSCRDSHDIVVLTMLRSDLNRLLQFIYTGESKLLTKTMITSLKKGVKGFKDEMPTLQSRD